MKHFTQLTALILSLGLMTACPAEEKKEQDPPSSAPVASAQSEADLKKGQEVSQALLKELKGTLTATLKAGGPQAALKTCNATAYPLTQKIADAQGVQLKRVSFQTRNPQNSPDQYEAELLLKLESMKEKGEITPETEVHQVIGSDNVKEFIYLKPIMVQQGCLQCHGSAEQIKISDELKSLYPHDQAVGYKEGDLRGAVSVRWKL